MKKVYTISNSHIDPMWQWDWEEGAAVAISTFRVAADFCDEHDGYVFNHNEALLYMWTEEYEPELFKRIQRLVKEGKWHIMGGWYLQPDCNMPSGETFMRHIQDGREYFKKKFGVIPTTAINFDSFGHSRGLVQILAKNGYDSYIHTRPGNDVCTLPSDLYIWEGYDGSKVIAKRAIAYGNSYGKAMNLVQTEMNAQLVERDCAIALWGMGDHGGGASRPDIEAIDKCRGEKLKEGIDLHHGYAEEYFDDVKCRIKSGEITLPTVSKSLNPWAVGCYTSHVFIKQKYRRLENDYYTAEKMCSAAYMQGLLAKYPEEELKEARLDMLMATFHDYLTGTSTEPTYNSEVRKLEHGIEICSRLKTRAFFALCKGQRSAKPDEIPFFIYNQHPYPVEDDFECEFMMWDQNWTASFDIPLAYSNGKSVPTQTIKENSNVPIDWRKKVVVHATIPPMCMSRFDCKFTRVDSYDRRRYIPAECFEKGVYTFKTDAMTVDINLKTGLIDHYVIDEKDYVGEGAFSLKVIADNFDPWGMTVTSYKNFKDEFKLMTDEECRRFCHVTDPITAVHIVEDGDVYTVIEALFKYEDSKASIRYVLHKNMPCIDLQIRVYWAEKQEMVKLAVPYLGKCDVYEGETVYGKEAFSTDGEEHVSQRYILFGNKQEGAMYVANDCVYGSSAIDNTLYISLLRSTGYTAHPLGPDRKVMREDRLMPYSEQGERCFNIRIGAGSYEDASKQTVRAASVFNAFPFSVSFFPAGNEDKKSISAVTADSDSYVEMSALYYDSDKDKYVMRLFNVSDEDKTVDIKTCIGTQKSVTVKKREFDTVEL